MIAVLHGHHNRLISWLDSFEERVEDIKRFKPASEHKLRLRLMKPVKGELPAELVTAWEAFVTARGAYETARQASGTARRPFETAQQAFMTARRATGTARGATGTAQQAFVTARGAYETAQQATDTAWRAYEIACHAAEQLYSKHLPAIEALHAIECPDCPWDGESIFPRRTA